MKKRSPILLSVSALMICASNAYTLCTTFPTSQLQRGPLGMLNYLARLARNLPPQP